MSKKKKNRGKSAGGKWLPPKNARKYFEPASDADFKRRHPIGYPLLVLLGITALILPCVVYTVCYYAAVGGSENETVWGIIGWVGAFMIGICLFNFVSIIIKQYLGHFVSIIFFVLGSALVIISILNW